MDEQIMKKCDMCNNMIDENLIDDHLIAHLVDQDKQCDNIR